MWTIITQYIPGAKGSQFILETWDYVPCIPEPDKKETRKAAIFFNSWEGKPGNTQKIIFVMLPY